MAQRSDVRKEVESWLVTDFPQIYLEYFNQRQQELRPEELKRIEKEIFEVLAKSLDDYITENCREIIIEEIQEFLQSNKFKKLILSMLVENSK